MKLFFLEPLHNYILHLNIYRTCHEFQKAFFEITFFLSSRRMMKKKCRVRKNSEAKGDGMLLNW